MSYLGSTREEGWLQTLLKPSSLPPTRCNRGSARCCMELSALKRAQLRLHCFLPHPSYSLTLLELMLETWAWLSVLQGFNWPFQNCWTNFLGLHVGQALSPGSWYLASSLSFFLPLTSTSLFFFFFLLVPTPQTLPISQTSAFGKRFPKASGSASGGPHLQASHQLCERPCHWAKAVLIMP